MGKDLDSLFGIEPFVRGFQIETRPQQKDGMIKKLNFGGDCHLDDNSDDRMRVN